MANNFQEAWGQQIRTDMYKHTSWRNDPYFASYSAICSLKGPLSLLFWVETIQKYLYILLNATLRSFFIPTNISLILQFAQYSSTQL